MTTDRAKVTEVWLATDNTQPVAAYYRVSKARDEMGALRLHGDQIRRYCDYREFTLGEILRDGNACDGRLRAVDTLRFHGELFAKLSLAYGCAESASHSYEVHYSLFFDSLSRAEMRAQANVANYELAGETGRILFEPGNARLSVSAPPR